VVNRESRMAALTRELREVLERQTATAGILQIIASSPSDVQPVFDAVADHAMRLLDCWSVIVTRFDGEYVQFGAARGALPDTEQFVRQRYQSMRPDRASLLGRSLLERSVVSSADAQAEPDPQLRDYARKRGLRAVLIVPLLRDDRVEGALVLSRAEPGLFATREIELVQTFADQAVIAIQNARLFDEVKARTRDLAESLEQQTATSEVLEVISASTGELESVFQKMLENATRVCGANFGVMSLYDGDSFRNVAFYNVPSAFGSSPQTFRPQPESAMGMAARTKQAVQFEDVRTHAPYLEGNPTAVAIADLAGARTLVAVPMLRENEVVGAIAIYRQEVRPFTGKQIELVANFASQAVIAIENARLLNELRKRTDDLSESLEQQTATSEVLQVISSSPGELEPVFQKMLENAARVCGANFGILNLYDGDRFEIVAIYNVPPAYAASLNSKLIRPHPESPLGTLVRTRQVVHIHDLTKSPVYLAGDPAVVAITDVAGARTIVIVPMVKEDELIGTIAFYRKEIRPFNDKQIALVENFTKQAVIAIENTRLLKELRARTDDLSESLQQQTATADVLKVISRSAFDLGTVTTAILRSAMELCKAPTGLLHLRDANVFRLKLALGHNQETVTLNLAVPIPLHDALHRSGSVHPGDYGHYEDMWNDPDYRFKKAVKMAGVRAGVVVPMFREDEVIGLFSLARPDPGPFTPGQIKLVQTFADQAAIAIENVRLFNEVKTKTDDLSEALQMQTATSDVLKVISRSAFDLQAVFNTLVSSAVELGGALTGTICVRDGNVYRYRDTIGAEHTSKLAQYLRDNPATPGRSTIAGRVLLSGKVERIPDCLVDPEYVVPMGSLATNVRSLLGVPLLRNEGVEGAIILTREEPGHFTDRQVEIVQIFADQAVIALENVRLFEEVRARTKELAASLDELQRAQDRLVQTEKLASLGQLTAGIAHEIKNPLNFVNNFSALSAELIDELKDVLRPAALDHKTREEIDELTQMLKGNLEKVVQHGKRADSIVKNMLLHSREGSGEHRPADINAIVEESLNLAYHGARAEKSGFNITLKRDLDPAAGMIDLYLQEITRVFLNLISNGFYAAAKRQEAGEEGFEPALSATTKNLGDRVEIRIRDNGTGIPFEVKEKMFNPFFTTKPAGEGTGLGLSMSHDIVVKQHGGKIDVETEPGRFTEFIITLPRTAAAQAHSGGQN
jgi:two-component system, NtrC family, sensor kinase